MTLSLRGEGLAQVLAYAVTTCVCVAGCGSSDAAQSSMEGAATSAEAGGSNTGGGSGGGNGGRAGKGSATSGSGGHVATGAAATAGKAGSTAAARGGSGGKKDAAQGGGGGATGGMGAKPNGAGGTTATSAAGTPAAGASGSVAAAGAGGAAGAPAEPACEMMVPSSMDCSAKLAPGDERTCMIGTRSYIVYAGKSLNLCKPTALVIDAHGASETAEEQAGEKEFCAGGTTCWHGLGSGWKAEADTPGGGFIVVFPQGINNMWSTTDADFMVNIVDEIKKVADIDPKKVYMSGISNGAALTYWTGCPHSDIFHGMAPNAGGANCTSVKQPVPLIQFDDEPDFAYQGSVQAVNTMVRLNNCKGMEKPWVTVDKDYTEAVCRSKKEDVTATLVPCNEVKSMIEPTVCTQWDQCDGGVKVVFCKVAANTEHGASNAALDGHIIYENNTILNTPSLAWRFFKSFW